MELATETGCCPRFDPEPWDGKEVRWEDRKFVHDRVPSLLHVPLGFGRVMKRNMVAIEAAGARDPENVVLADACSPWRTEVYIAVSGDVPGADERRLTGTYHSKVFEGPYSAAGRFAKETNAALAAEGRAAKKLWFWYTTCPRCAKAYGKNYVVVLAEL